MPHVAKSDWTVDLEARTALHRPTGLTLSVRLLNIYGDVELVPVRVRAPLPVDVLQRLRRQGAAAYANARSAARQRRARVWAETA